MQIAIVGAPSSTGWQAGGLHMRRDRLGEHPA
jgi:hypothetical protein